LSAPPDEVLLSGEWAIYEDLLYQVYLDTVAHAGLSFQGEPVKVQFRPETRGKGFGFWHLISEAPEQSNRNEDERLPDLARCRRIRWVAWCITHAEQPGFSWWENRRGRETHVVIWAEVHDFAVVLAKRQSAEGMRFYLLKTAYCLRAHTKRKFAKERDAFRAAQKG